MAETWYFRSSAGAACGAGDREALSQTAGSSVQTKVMDTTGDTWNRTEAAARTIQSGDWQVSFRMDVSAGGGPAVRHTVLVERRNSSCVVQETIINEQIILTKGATQTYTTSLTNPGAVTFAAGDILTILMRQTGGSRVQTLRYDDAPSDECFLTHPDEAAAGGPRRIFVIG